MKITFISLLIFCVLILAAILTFFAFIVYKKMEDNDGS